MPKGREEHEHRFRYALDPARGAVAADALHGRSIGHVSSAIYSPRLKKNVGYALVPIGYTTLDTTFTVMVEETEARAATVVPRPFIDPKKDIPKS